MFSIVIKHKDERGETEYKVYTKQEADEAGIEYVYWQDVEEVGQWVISDDGYVGKCVQTKWYKDHNNRRNSPMNKYVRTPFAVAYHKPGRTSNKLVYTDRENTYSLKGKRELQGKKKKIGRDIARVFARTSDLEYSIAEIERRNPGCGNTNWYKWTKTGEFSDMVGDELTKLLAAQGFDKAQTLELLKRTVELAEGKGNINAMLKAFEMLIKMHGIDKPAEVKTTKKLEARKIGGYLEDATREEDMIEFRQSQTEVTTDKAQPEKEIVDEQDDKT